MKWRINMTRQFAGIYLRHDCFLGCFWMFLGAPFSYEHLGLASSMIGILSRKIVFTNIICIFNLTFPAIIYTVCFQKKYVKKLSLINGLILKIKLILHVIEKKWLIIDIELIFEYDCISHYNKYCLWWILHSNSP